jgi:hypothetical protein
LVKKSKLKDKKDWINQGPFLKEEILEIKINELEKVFPNLDLPSPHT